MARRHTVTRMFSPTARALQWPTPLVDGRLFDRPALAGHWRRPRIKLPLRTLDPRRLEASDHIDIPRGAVAEFTLPVLIKHYRWRRNLVSFRDADSAYTRRDTRLQGFLYYHVPFPAAPLSGAVRFRCCPPPAHGPGAARAAFTAGHDLLTPDGLPWALPLVRFVVRARVDAFLRLLVTEGLVSPALVRACQKRVVTHAPPRVLLHAVAQPWAMDLSAPAVVHVPGPHGPLRCELYPAIAYSGHALVRLEPARPHSRAASYLPPFPALSPPSLSSDDPYFDPRIPPPTVHAPPATDAYPQRYAALRDPFAPLTTTPFPSPPPPFALPPVPLSPTPSPSLNPHLYSDTAMDVAGPVDPARAPPLVLRVLAVRGAAHFRPQFSALRGLVRGALLPDPARVLAAGRGELCAGEGLGVWRWGFDTRQSHEQAAGLYCLLNPPPIDVGLTRQDVDRLARVPMPRHAHGALFRGWQGHF